MRIKYAGRMIMKKKILTVLMAVTVSSMLLMGCGGSSDAAEPSSAAEEAAEETTEAEAEATDAEETEAAETEDAEATEAAASDGSFSLLDVTSDMIQSGLYATDDNGGEYVFSLFTAPDGEQFASLFVFDNNESSGDVICGPYTAASETDDNGIAWTMLTVSDVYTGNEFKIGCAEPDDGSCYIFDQNANVYTAKYLSADETIAYMGSAAALMQ